MFKKIKDKIVGKRLLLKRTKPSIKMAKTMFKVVDENREYLGKWLPWADVTKKVEDSYNYLYEKEKEFKDRKKIEYGIYLKDKYIGNIAIFHLDKDNKSGELGYWLSGKYAGNGYMTEAVSLIEKEFFQNQKINRIVIKCDEKNIASKKVTEKSGYLYEGKHREAMYSKKHKSYRNVLCYSKLKKEYKKWILEKLKKK